MPTKLHGVTSPNPVFSASHVTISANLSKWLDVNLIHRAVHIASFIQCSIYLHKKYFTWTKINLSGRGLVYVKVLAQGLPNPWSRPEVSSRDASDSSRFPKIVEWHWRGPVWAGIYFGWLCEGDLRIWDINQTCDNRCFNLKFCY